MSMPVLIHLLFHPALNPARMMASEIHRALNDDPALPGLRVPTVLAEEDGTGLPPLRHNLGEADRCVIVPLIDDKMVIRPQNLPQGRMFWSQFVGGLREKCERPSRRFIPVQLSKNAWPLDARLNGTSFLHADVQPDESRTSWVTRALVVEICRFLQQKDRGDQMPVRLFISHAKGDILAEPKVFEAITSHLAVTQPVEAWVDSAKIPGGSQFAVEIAKGVSNSALLVLATRSYSSRPWCRKELLLAKRLQRPVVIVDALEGLDIRSFPYGGNVPTLRWSEDGASKAVDLILRETLRQAHVRLGLEKIKREQDAILSSHPELTTVVRFSAGTSILYPDPPLGDEELEEFTPLGHKLQTPLQRAAEGRSLSKMPILLSISESEDLARYGLLREHLDAALLEISRQLLVRGACLEYGGNLGSEGYTIALFDMAIAYSALSGLPSGERIINDVGWPNPLETLSDAVRAKYQGVAELVRIGRPEGVEDLEPNTFIREPKFFPADTPGRRFAWARGMTGMREEQARKAQARIVLGGKTGPTINTRPDGTRETKWYSGRIPGVVEEALLSLRAGQPLYLIGAFGGAAALIIDLLEGIKRDDFTWEYQSAAPHSEAMRRTYLERKLPWEDYSAMTEEFNTAGVEGISSKNRLTEEQNRELFTCRDLDRIVELLLQGLTALRGPIS
jgi:hypothetical protein